MLNNISLQGRLVRDPELRTTPNGKTVARFTIACDRGGKDMPTDFIDCAAWSGTAQMVSKYFVKGNMILVTGRLQSRKWEDKEGKQRTSWEVLVNSVSFCESKAAVAPPEIKEIPGGEEDLPF